MSYIFSNCSSLISIDLSNFNINNVEDMNHIFFKCSSLISLNLSILIFIMLLGMWKMFDDIPKNCKIIHNDSRINENLKNN